MEQIRQLAKKRNVMESKLQRTDYQSIRDNATITLARINGVDDSEIQEVIVRFIQSEKQRQAWRDEINEIEAQIESLRQNMSSEM